MTDLIARLEEATEGGWLLDSEISATVHGMLDQDWDDPRWHEGGPAYTTSLDAALTLVPEGSAWAVSIGDDPDVYIRGMPRATVMPPRPYSGANDASECAATPALALCIAALKARQDET